MKYNQPFDQTSPDAPYVDGNPAAGIMGSIPRAAALEYTQREIVAAITGSDQDPSNGDLGQLWKAILKAVSDGAPAPALWHTGTASGTASNLTVVNVTPAIAGETDFLPCLIRVPQGVATGATLTIGSLSGSLQRNDGSPIQAGDGPPGSDVLVARHGGAWRLIGFGRAEVPIIPSIAPTLYVRTDGNDANDGSANDPGHAFRTIAAAFSYGVSRFSFAGTSLVVQLGNAGTFDAPGTIPAGTGQVTLRGDPTNQAAFVIAGTGPLGGAAVLPAGGRLNISGVTIRQTGTGGHVLAATSNAVCIIDHVTLIAGAANSSLAHLFATGGANVTISEGCAAQGSTGSLYQADGGVISQNGLAINVQGSPNFGLATAFAVNGGRIQALAGASILGGASGKRYLAALNSVISVNGGGYQFFPGAVDGTTETGGIYAP